MGGSAPSKTGTSIERIGGTSGRIAALRIFISALPESEAVTTGNAKWHRSTSSVFVTSTEQWALGALVNVKGSRLTHLKLNQPGIIAFVLSRHVLLIDTVKKRNPRLHAQCTSGARNLLYCQAGPNMPQRYSFYPLDKAVHSCDCNKVSLGRDLRRFGDESFCTLAQLPSFFVSFAAPY